MVTQTITINLTQSRLAPIIMRSEEKGREIQFEVINEAGEPEDLTDYSLKFMMLKPDENVVYSDLASDILTQTEQMTTSKGKGYYCIRILDEDTIIYSGQGPVVIDDHVIDDETLDSISEVDGLLFPDDFATTDNIQEVVEDVISGMSFAVINDNHQNLTETWSSEKIADYAAVMADGLIADNQIALDHTWSSDKINTELIGKAIIDDETESSQYTWSSSKIKDEIDDHSEIDDNNTSTDSTWSSTKISNEIAGAGGGGVAYSTTPKIVGTYNDGANDYDVYEVTIESTQSNPDGGNYVAFPDTVTKIISINGTFSGLINGYDRYYSPAGMYFKKYNIEYSFGVQIDINTNPPRIYYVFYSSNTNNVNCDRQTVTIQYLK